jgi:hypothetical protein
MRGMSRQRPNKETRGSDIEMTTGKALGSDSKPSAQFGATCQPD